MFLQWCVAFKVFKQILEVSNQGLASSCNLPSLLALPGFPYKFEESAGLSHDAYRVFLKPPGVVRLLGTDFHSLQTEMSILVCVFRFPGATRLSKAIFGGH